VLIVVSYDVPDDRRRARLAQELESFGRRVQYSVFECLLDAEQLARLRTRMLRHLEPQEDSLRIYRLCQECCEKVEIHGLGTITEDPKVYVV
jgi:CRISPR-associated protein Cas2